jgi:hypothetical protein
MSTYTIPTIQKMALRMLRYIGVTSFLPQPAGSQLESLGPGDLDDVANAISGALQDVASIGPAESNEAPAYGVLNAPTAITLNVNAQSPTISSITGWVAWMQGCTIRIGGDSQDNEILSQTTLARAYMGPTTTAAGATVYGDCITLDDTVGKIRAPLWLPNQLPLYPATDRQTFMQLGMYPAVTFAPGISAGWPYYLYYRKSIGIPRVWFIDGAYDMSLGYTQRRIRFSPMPDTAYPVSYSAGINPPRVTSADIVSPLTTLVVSGATSDTNINQTYVYVCDFAGFRLFAGQTHTAYAIFFNPVDASYQIYSSISTLSLAGANCWVAAQPQSPLGTFTPTNAATGTVTVTTTDTGGGQGDPGTVVPIPNAWVEAILLPIAIKRFSGTPVFKNDKALPEIDRAYKSALQSLKDSRGQESVPKAIYSPGSRY